MRSNYPQHASTSFVGFETEIRIGCRDPFAAAFSLESWCGLERTSDAGWVKGENVPSLGQGAQRPAHSTPLSSIGKLPQRQIDIISCTLIIPFSNPLIEIRLVPKMAIFDP